MLVAAAKIKLLSSFWAPATNISRYVSGISTVSLLITCKSVIFDLAVSPIETAYASASAEPSEKSVVTRICRNTGFVIVSFAEMVRTGTGLCRIIDSVTDPITQRAKPRRP